MSTPSPQRHDFTAAQLDVVRGKLNQKAEIDRFLSEFLAYIAREANMPKTDISLLYEPDGTPYLSVTQPAEKQ